MENRPYSSRHPDFARDLVTEPLMAEELGERPCMECAGPFLPLRMWLMFGSQGQQTQRSRRTIVVVGRLITLRRCFRTRVRATIWVAWSTSLGHRNQDGEVDRVSVWWPCTVSLLLRSVTKLDSSQPGV